MEAQIRIDWHAISVIAWTFIRILGMIGLLIAIPIATKGTAQMSIGIQISVIVGFIFGIICIVIPASQDLMWLLDYFNILHITSSTEKKDVQA